MKGLNIHLQEEIIVFLKEERNRKISLCIIPLLFFSLSLVSCASIPIGKVSEEAGKREIPRGPDAGYSVTQKVTLITDALFTLTSGKGDSVTRKRSGGMKIVSRYVVKERNNLSFLLSVTLMSVEDLSQGRFVSSKMLSYHPPTSFTLQLDLLQKKIDLSRFTLVYGEWRSKVEKSSAWGVVVTKEDMDAFISRLREAVVTPLDTFYGKKLKLGEEVAVHGRYVLPLADVTFMEKPFDVKRRETMKGVMKTPGGEVAIVEGNVKSVKSYAGEEFIHKGLSLFSTPLKGTGRVEGEMASKYRARVDTGSGWLVEMFERVRGVILSEVDGGTLREEIFIKKMINEM